MTKQRSEVHSSLIASASSQDTTRRALLPSSVVLALLILGLGLWTALSTARIVYTTYSPIIYADQWSIIRDLKQWNGVVSIPMLWAQHGEHRIPVGRIAVLADLRFFGGRNVSLLIEIYLVQLCLVLLFTWMCRYFGQFRRIRLATVCGFFSYCLFCPLQIENFFWGFQIAFVFAGLAAAVSFACVIWHAAKIASGKANWISPPLVLAFIAAFLAEGSLADGIFVWPTLVYLGFLLHFPRRTQLLSGTVGLAGAGLYLAGYHSLPSHPNPWVSMRHPLSIAKFVTTYFAYTWDSAIPSFSLWPTVSESMTVLAIAFVLGTALWLLLVRPSVPYLLRSFLISNLLLAVITAVLTGLGRLNYGLAYAISSRFQSVALLFWASLAALILTFIPKTRSGSIAFVGVQVVLLVLMAATEARFAASELSARQHQVSLATAYAAFAFDPPDLEALKPLNPEPDKLPVLYAYARAHNLAPDASEFVPRRWRLLKAVPGWGGYHVVAMSNCLGFLDAVHRIAPNGVAAQGWAWDINAKRVPRKIVFALPNGLLVGLGEVDTPRPDVQAANRTISDPVTGWNGEALAPKGILLRAFAVLSDSTSICPLNNEIQVR